MASSYEQSHPWLRFTLSLERIGPRLWMLLGEAASKVEHLSNAALRPGAWDELSNLYLAKGVHATAAIEGNTLTEDQARRLVEGRLDVPKSQRYLRQEMENVLAAFDAMQRRALEASWQPFAIEDILASNATLLRDLPGSEEKLPGAIRTSSVGVADYLAPSHSECHQLLQRLCAWLNSPEFRNPGLDAVPLGLLRGIVAHVYLAWVHPFGDGNGRTARLLEARMLLEAGIPVPTCHLLSNHYNKTRSEYYR